MPRKSWSRSSPSSYSQRNTPSKTNIAPENGWLEDYSSLERPIFRGELLVSGEGTSMWVEVLWKTKTPHVQFLPRQWQHGRPLACSSTYKLTKRASASYQSQPVENVQMWLQHVWLMTTLLETTSMHSEAIIIPNGINFMFGIIQVLLSSTLHKFHTSQTGSITWGSSYS